MREYLVLLVFQTSTVHLQILETRSKSGLWLAGDAINAAATGNSLRKKAWLGRDFTLQDLGCNVGTLLLII